MTAKVRCLQHLHCRRGVKISLAFNAVLFDVAQRLSLALMSTQSLNQPLTQAPPDVGQDVLAIVCVIDASLSLATEWTRVLTGYISPILQRLYETYSGYQVSFTVLLGSELDGDWF